VVYAGCYIICNRLVSGVLLFNKNFFVFPSQGVTLHMTWYILNVTS